MNFRTTLLFDELDENCDNNGIKSDFHRIQIEWAWKEGRSIEVAISSILSTCNQTDGQKTSCNSKFQITFVSNYPYKLFSCSSTRWRIVMITKRNSERSQKDCKICSSQFQTTFISNHPYKLFSCSSIQWRIIKSNPKRTNVNGRKIGDIDFVRVQRSQKDCKRTSCSSEFQTPLLFTDSLDSMKNYKKNGMKLRETVKKKSVISSIDFVHM